MGNLENLRNSYQEKMHMYNELCKELNTQISALLDESNIELAIPIQYRVKTYDSIVEKCNRYKLDPSDIEEINDVAGLRIIALFKKDINSICETLNKYFIVSRMEDTSDRLSDNQFGYGSIHFEITTKDEWTHVPTLRKLKGLKAEVQVRTASQHIWASTSHILQYKQESNVPIPLRRSINRTAALLEMVDLEFERLLSERDSYLENITEVNQESELNTDVLRSILENNFSKANKSNQENYTFLLDDLKHFGISTIKDLNELLIKHKKYILAEEEKQLKRAIKKLENGIKDNLGTSEERIRKGIYYSYMGLLRKALRAEYGTTNVDNYLSEVSKNRKNK